MSPAPEQEKVGDAHCPNCNAKAVVLLRRRKRSQPWWEMFLRCDKCKGEWPWVGPDGSGPLMHDGNKRRIERHHELMKRWKKAKSPRERGRIMAEVQRMAKEEKEWVESL